MSFAYEPFRRSAPASRHLQDVPRDKDPLGLLEERLTKLLSPAPHRSDLQKAPRPPHWVGSRDVRGHPLQGPSSTPEGRTSGTVDFIATSSYENYRLVHTDFLYRLQWHEGCFLFGFVVYVWPKSFQGSWRVQVGGWVGRLSRDDGYDVHSALLWSPDPSCLPSLRPHGVLHFPAHYRLSTSSNSPRYGPTVPLVHGDGTWPRMRW